MALLSFKKAIRHLVGFFLFPAVYFAVPKSVTVDEGNSVQICVEMSSTTAQATLGLDVVVTLSASDGTGTVCLFHSMMQCGT